MNTATHISHNELEINAGIIELAIAYRKGFSETLTHLLRPKAVFKLKKSSSNIVLNIYFCLQEIDTVHLKFTVANSNNCKLETLSSRLSHCKFRLIVFGPTGQPLATKIFLRPNVLY